MHAHDGWAGVRDLSVANIEAEEGVRMREEEDKSKETKGAGSREEEDANPQVFAQELVNKMQARIAMEGPHACKRKRVSFEENSMSTKYLPNHTLGGSGIQNLRGFIPRSVSNGIQGCSAPNEERWPWIASLRRDQSGRAPKDPKYDPSTLLIPKEAWENLKEFDKQFWNIKSQRMDLVLFVRCGSFYNLFDIDADIGTRVGLNACGKPKPNMWKVGCTATSFTTWANKILALGHAVGRVEELDNDDQKNKLLDRKLMAVYTPGIANEDAHFTPASTCEAKTVLCIAENEGGLIGICRLDAYTGQISTVQFKDGPERRFLSTMLACENPVEIIHIQGKISARTTRTVQEYRRISEFSNVVRATLPTECFAKVHGSLRELRKLISKNPDNPAVPQKTKPLASHIVLLETQNRWTALDALDVLICHLQRCMCEDRILSAAQFRLDEWFDGRGNHMLLDSSAIHNLNILEGTVGTKEGSLLNRIDKTVTAAGRRMISRWVCSPLQDVEAIQNRYDTVEVFYSCPKQADRFQKSIQGLPDGEQVLGAIYSVTHFLLDQCNNDGTLDITALSPKMVSLLSAIEGQASAITELVASLSTEKNKLPIVLNEACAIANRAKKLLGEVHQLLAFQESKEKGELKPKPGAYPAYDRAGSERERLLRHLEEGLAGLRHNLSRKYFLLEGKPAPPRLVQSVDYVNTVLEGTGNIEYLYQVSVPSKLAPFVPSEWLEIRKTKGSTFFKVPSTNSLVVALVAEEKMRATAYAKFLQMLVEKIAAGKEHWSSLFHIAANIDVLVGFTRACTTSDLPANCTFCRPCILDSLQGNRHQIKLTQGWNLLLKERRSIVCNDVLLGGEHPSGVILYGANSGGKSTLLRQVALSVLLAQIGCFVPASEMKLTLVDRIFTRIGANDSIMSGHSTFALEMEETSIILRHASANSLAILDELGRGTSTRDGYALAFSVLDYLSSGKPCMLLFASHFHELSKEEGLNSLSVWHMRSSTDARGRFKPEYSLAKGSSPEGSCGIHVAGVAGIPASVLQSAAVQADRYRREKTSKPRASNFNGNATEEDCMGEPISPQEERLYQRLCSTGILHGKRVFSEEWCINFWQLWLDVRGHYRARGC
eukprot:scaffold287_cov337-Pavlova_lutheri.AAC.164